MIFQSQHTKSCLWIRPSITVIAKLDDYQYQNLLQMLREIHIDAFSKIITSFKPQLFSTLTILESRPYNPNVELYIASDQHQNFYQLYLTEKDLEPILKDIQFIERSPKILLLKTERDHIIIEEQVNENLYEMLLAMEGGSVPTPYLEESLARGIVRSLKEVLQNYASHEIEYNAINPRNIVRRGGEWELSLAGLLLRNEKESPDYYKTDVRREGSTAYALGTLLFKLLFGFVPFERRKERFPFAFKDYLKQLDKEQSKKALKTYYFADRLLEVSQSAKQLIELALKGDMSISAFYSHDYFDKFALPGARKITGGNREIKMLSLFVPGQQSAVMAAIDHRRKYPQERINARLLFAHEFSPQEVVTHLQRHPVLCQVDFAEGFRQQKVKDSLRPPTRDPPRLRLEYFYREEEFDPDTDFPCRDLIKVIDLARTHWQAQSEKPFDRQEALIKMYAFPYAMVFQLMKVANGQPEEVLERIYRLVEDMLQVSQLHFTKLIEPLHHTELVVRSFEDIKLRFRESINWLYRHFLAQAIRRYNIKKESIQYAERTKSKLLGLEYYRLCLKLMECSLIVRKEGKDLDLHRIETSERREIERDLNQLLRQYFPNKIELN